MDKPFLTDIKELRRRARSHMEAGAVTEGYRADRGTVLRLLNEALATELVCVLRYKRHYYMAAGIHAQAAAAEFLEHANEEQGHADLIAERIVQLGGAPDMTFDGLLSRSHSECVEGTDLIDMIREGLAAERIAVGSRRSSPGKRDPPRTCACSSTRSAGTNAGPCARAARADEEPGHYASLGHEVLGS